jgi:signal transduction histidine kinase
LSVFQKIPVIQQLQLTTVITRHCQVLAAALLFFNFFFSFGGGLHDFRQQKSGASLASDFSFYSFFIFFAFFPDFARSGRSTCLLLLVWLQTEPPSKARRRGTQRRLLWIH